MTEWDIDSLVVSLHRVGSIGHIQGDVGYQVIMLGNGLPVGQHYKCYHKCTLSQVGTCPYLPVDVASM